MSEGNTVEKLTVHPVNLETNTVKIEGVSGKKYVNIIILNPGVNISSNGQFEDGVQNHVSVKTSENGYFSAVQINPKVPRYKKQNPYRTSCGIPPLPPGRVFPLTNPACEGG